MTVEQTTKGNHTLVVFRSMSEIWEFRSALLTMHPQPDENGHPRDSWFDKTHLEKQYQWISELLAPSSGKGYALSGIGPSKRVIISTPDDIQKYWLYPTIGYRVWGSNDWGWMNSLKRKELVDASTGEAPPNITPPWLVTYEPDRRCSDYKDAPVVYWADVRGTLHPPRYNDL